MRSTGLALCLFMLLATGAAATTHTVDPGGTGDYPTIQAAINASAPGDTVELTFGSFTGTGNRDLNYGGKAITVRSASGDPEDTAIDCAGYRGVSFTSGEGADSVLEGIAFWYGDGDVGGGVKCIGSSPTITNCTFAYCTAGVNGGGLHCVDSSPSLTDCGFSHDDAAQYGGAAYCDSLSAPSFVSCFFGANSADRGAGVACDGADPVLDDCRFEGNIAAANGAGVYCWNGAAPALNLCSFKWNDATANGGGAYLASGASGSFTGCTFTENVADKGAGIVLSSTVAVTFVDCAFDLNTAQQGGGGAYVYAADSTCVFANCDFDHNSSDINGGAVHLRSSSARLTDCDFTYNSTTSGSGGALYCREGSAPVIGGCYFSDNDTPLQGGAIYASNSPLELSDCLITWNDADQDGGGLYASGARVTLHGCRFFQNESSLTGGGAAIAEADSSIFEYCVFASNRSDTDGAAIASHTASPLTIRNCTLDWNAPSPGGGAAARFVDTDALLENSIITSTLLGDGVHCYGGGGALASCCDIFGNNGGAGDWVDCLAGQQYSNGNLSVDPLFCANFEYNFHLAWESPCRDHGSCGQIGAYGLGCGLQVESIVDVGNDQGRRVYVTWNRAHDDEEGATDPVTEYTLWRRIDAREGDGGKQVVNDAASGGGNRYPPGSWCYAGTVPAFCEDTYTASCETVCDSTAAEGICWSVFFVRAGYGAPAEYIDSPPDSGYSVDNLAPAIPGRLMADGDEALVALSWDRNEEEDLDYYAVYRDTVEDFVPGTPIGYAITESFDDADPPQASEWWYRVTATDFSGNESGPSAPAGVVGTGVPGGQSATYWLGPVIPNPFTATAEVSYRVPHSDEQCAVEILVYDASGRLVRTLVDRVVPPGVHTATWDGRDNARSLVSSGVYFCRMRAGDYSSRRKMILLK